MKSVSKRLLRHPTALSAVVAVVSAGCVGPSDDPNSESAQGDQTSEVSTCHSTYTGAQSMMMVYWGPGGTGSRSDCGAKIYGHIFSTGQNSTGIIVGNYTSTTRRLHVHVDFDVRCASSSGNAPSYDGDLGPGENHRLDAHCDDGDTAQSSVAYVIYQDAH